MAKERTLIIFKPDAVMRSLVGEILARFERAGLKIVGMKMMLPSAELAAKHYPEDAITRVGNKTIVDWEAWGIKNTKTAEEIGRNVLDDTRKYLSSGPVVAVVLEADHVVEVVRKMAGSTGPKDSAPGTIRGDYAHIALGRASLARKGGTNLLHASGSPEEAAVEIAMWFKPEELMPEYKLAHEYFTHA